MRKVKYAIGTPGKTDQCTGHSTDQQIKPPTFKSSPMSTLMERREERGQQKTQQQNKRIQPNCFPSNAAKVERHRQTSYMDYYPPARRMVITYHHRIQYRGVDYILGSIDLFHFSRPIKVLRSFSQKNLTNNHEQQHNCVKDRSSNR